MKHQLSPIHIAHMLPKEILYASKTNPKNQQHSKKKKKFRNL